MRLTTCADPRCPHHADCDYVWQAGVLFRWGSAWVGVHYAPNHRRVCINLIPFVTIWITAPGGDVP